MINGIHALVYARNAEKVRAFFRDVLEFPHVDAGEGWLIFALPPAELGVHPTDGGEEHHELYLMCDDLEATIAELARKAVKCSPPQDMGWGVATMLSIPGGGKLGMYEPRHPRAAGRKRAAARRKRAAKAAKAPKRAKAAPGRSRSRRRSS